MFVDAPSTSASSSDGWVFGPHHWPNTLLHNYLIFSTSQTVSMPLPSSPSYCYPKPFSESTCLENEPLVRARAHPASVLAHPASVLAAHLGFTRTPLSCMVSHFRDTLSSWLFLNILKFLFILLGFYLKIKTWVQQLRERKCERVWQSRFIRTWR